MSDHFCSLIIVGPGAPQTLKLHLSRGAIAILVVAFLISFLAALWVGFSLPPAVSETGRAKLEEENRALKVEASNAVLRIQKLDAKVNDLEQQSKRINEMLVPAATD